MNNYDRFLVVRDSWLCVLQARAISFFTRSRILCIVLLPQLAYCADECA